MSREITLAKCDKCGEFHNPSAGHMCTKKFVADRLNVTRTVEALRDIFKLLDVADTISNNYMLVELSSRLEDMKDDIATVLDEAYGEEV